MLFKNKKNKSRFFNSFGIWPVKLFEDKLKSYFQAEHVISLNSCTAALHLALAAKGFGAGDKFIVPTYTFVASVEVGEYLGMEPVLVDSKIDSFNFNGIKCFWFV